MTLTNIEKSVLSMALDHMEEEMRELMEEHSDRFKRYFGEKLEACENLKTKLL